MCMIVKVFGMGAFCYDKAMTTHEGMKLPELIAPVGLDGTGKGHLTAYLREQGFLTFGASEILRSVKSEQPDLKDLHPDEAARLLKERLGSTFITDTAIAEYESKKGDHTGLAIDGLRPCQKSRELSNSTALFYTSMQTTTNDTHN